RGLLLQRFALFGNQAGILDGDHRLVGEGANQFQLSVSKWLDTLACKYDRPNGFAFTQQRHAKRASLPTQPDRDLSIAGFSGHVVNMHDAAFADGPRPDIPRVIVEWHRTQFPRDGLILWWKPIICPQSY